MLTIVTLGAISAAAILAAFHLSRRRPCGVAGCDIPANRWHTHHRAA